MKRVIASTCHALSGSAGRREEEGAEVEEAEQEGATQEAEEEEEEEEVEASVGSGTSLDAKVAAVVVEAAEGGVAAVTVRASEAAPSSLGMAV